MSTTSNFDADRMKAQAAQLRDTVAINASRAAVRAADLAGQGLEWAAPRAQAALENAVDRATPLLQEAADRASSAAVRAQEAAENVKPAIQEMHDRVVDDYLPRINRAATEAAVAVTSEGDLKDRARHALDVSSAALTTPTVQVHKPRRFLRALGFTALGAGIAGAGYILWKRSQPIEDPWAEEYWADIESEIELDEMAAEDVNMVEVEPGQTANEKLAALKDSAAEKLSELKDAAAEKLEEAKEVAEDAVEAVNEKVNDNDSHK